jgi:hypothetical protein
VSSRLAPALSASRSGWEMVSSSLGPTLRRCGQMISASLARVCGTAIRMMMTAAMAASPMSTSVPGAILKRHCHADERRGQLDAETADERQAFGYERGQVLGGRQVGDRRAEDRHGEPAGIGVAERAEDVRAGDLADQKVGGDGEGDRAGDGAPAEALEPDKRHGTAGSEKLVPELVQAGLVGAHRPPSPGRQGDRLQDGRDGPLVDGPVSLTQGVDGAGCPDCLGQGGQCLGQVKSPGQPA